MAQRNLAESKGSLSSNDQLPKDNYISRCIEVAFGPSKSSGNLMITKTWEMVTETCLVNGVPKNVAGITTKQYLTTLCYGEDGKTRDDKRSDAALARVAQDNKVLGLPLEIDDENPSEESMGKGVVAQVIWGSEEYIQCKAPTAEELAQGKTQGEPIKDESGKVLKGYKPKLLSVVGLSTVKVNVPY